MLMSKSIMISRADYSQTNKTNYGEKMRFR